MLNPTNDGVIFTGTVASSLDSVDFSPTAAQGTNIGIYVGGTYNLPGQSLILNTTYETFPFSISSGTYTTVPNLGTSRVYARGVHSPTHTYIAGNEAPSPPALALTGTSVDKYAPTGS